MINVSFVLRDPREKTSKIYMTCRWYGQILKWTTGLAILSKDWDQKKREPRNADPNCLLIKSEMLRLQKAVQAVYLSYKEETGGIIPKEIFKERLAVAIGRATDEPDNDTSLIRWARNWCKGKRPALMQALKTLEKYLNGKDLKFDEVNKVWVNKYVDWLKPRYKISTANGKVGALTQFLIESADEGLHNNRFKPSKCKIDTSKLAEQVPVALTAAELYDLATLDLEGDQEAARDLFMIGIYSGQRHSDYSRIKPRMIKDGKLEIVQKKTKKRVRIPLDLCDGWGLPISFEELLLKYCNASPDIPYHKFLAHIRQIAKKAGITEKVQVILEENCEQILDNEEPKCDVLGTHSSRRTFATLLYDAGLSLDTICRYTGHKSLKTLMRYIGKTEEEYEKAAYREAKQKIRSLVGTGAALRRAI